MSLSTLCKNKLKHLVKDRQTIGIKMVFSSWFSGSNNTSTDELPVPETQRGGYECAPYTILEKQEGYEVRKYPSRKWATVMHEKHDFQGNNDMPMSKEWKQQPQNKSFMKLFGYISGANEDNAKISMTVPVSTKVSTEAQNDGIIIKEEMGFYVPTEYQESTPEPHNEVKLVTRPEMVAYVREFGGYAKDKDWQDQKELLKKDLEERDDFDKIDFDTYFR